MDVLARIAASRSVEVVSGEMSRADVLRLYGRAHCYLSLHRSEGFGYTMAEAMMAGVPVVATGYSGNLEYMDADTALLVDYETTSIRPGEYLFWAPGMQWADPSTEHAAELLQDRGQRPVRQSGACGEGPAPRGRPTVVRPTGHSFRGAPRWALISLTRATVEAMGRAGAQRRQHDDGGVSAFVMNRFWLHVEPDDAAITPWMISDGFWEAWVTTWLMRQLRPGDVFVDVGANVGYYTMLARSLGARVLSFEPNPRVARLLQRSLDEVEASDVVLVTGALGDRVQSLDLSVPVGHSGGASIMGVADAEYTVSTLVRPLDDVLRSLPDYASPTIIKVDAEGAEPEIWQGMQETLLKNPACIVLMEWESGRFADPTALLDGIREGGWEIRVVDGAGDEQAITDDELAELGLQMVTVRRPNAPARQVTPLRRPYRPDYPYGHLWSVRLGFKHIPKSAGISLSQAIHSSWGLDYRSLLQVQASPEEEMHYLTPHVARFDDLDLWSGRPYVAGHVGIEDLARLNRTFVFTVLREPVVRSLSAYAYLRRRAEDGHTQTASGELGVGQRQALRLSPRDWFLSSRQDDMTRGLLQDAFSVGTPERDAADEWLSTRRRLSTAEAEWLIRGALDRIQVAYVGVDAARIVENLYLQGLLPTLPEVHYLNEAERHLRLEAVSYQDLYADVVESTVLDTLLIDIASDMFPGYVFDPCQPSFESFAETARRYGLEDTDSGHVR